MTAVSFSVWAPVPKPQPKPLVTTVMQRSFTQDWNRRFAPKEAQQAPVTQDPIKPRKSPVFCGHCASIMDIEQLDPTNWQCICPRCGTSGPRRPSAFTAAISAERLFEAPYA